MSEPKKRLCVRVNKEMIHIVEAIGFNVDPNGFLFLFGDRSRTVAAFAPGSWMSCSEEGQIND